MKRLMLTFGLYLVTAIYLVAQVDTTSTTQKDNVNDRILYVNITNPLLFGKAGMAFSIRNERMDYFLYANYRYSAGTLANTIYFSNGQYGKAVPSDNNSKTSGFDIGVQFRFRDPVLSKPYAKYLKNVEKASPFYAGLLVEVSYLNSTRSNNPFGYGFEVIESTIVEPSIGPVVGWTLYKGNVFFDIHMALAFGVSVINYDVTGAYYPVLEGPGKVTPGLFKYDFGFLIGYKF